MSCGRSSAISGARSGFGWQSTAIRVRLWVWRLEREPKRQLASCGPRSLPSTANVRFVTAISGKPMRPFCRPSAIEPLARRVAKPATSSVSTTPCASAVVGWFGKRSRSRRRRPITSAPFGTTSTTITHDNAPNSTSLLVYDYPPKRHGFVLSDDSVQARPKAWAAAGVTPTSSTGGRPSRGTEGPTCPYGETPSSARARVSARRR